MATDDPELRWHNLSDALHIYHLRIETAGGAADGHKKHLHNWESSPSIKERYHLFLYSGVYPYSAKTKLRITCARLEIYFRQNYLEVKLIRDELGKLRKRSSICNLSSFIKNVIFVL
ncbi:hypothetical protein O3G_MSEX009662 [Manduca sexta]|uniref:Uncharacterized protein n=1 Tax=Manduca sexta TaxID=7130 RepID=A0A921ZGB8_MANSE|nr:hypothetical protein O3G_MSEX009662 [Manduca sexta]